MSGSQAGTEPQGERARVWSNVKKVANFILAQYLIIGFGVACVLAYYFPGESSCYLSHISLVVLTLVRGRSPWRDYQV